MKERKKCPYCGCTIKHGKRHDCSKGEQAPLMFLILAVIGCATLSLGIAMIPLFRVSNVATIKVYGLSVWENQNTTQPLTSISWGMLDVGENKTFVCYVKSETNFPIVLTIYAENWIPPATSLWIKFTCDIEGEVLEVNEVREARLMLTVAPDISNITDFSFDIVFSCGS